MRELELVEIGDVSGGPGPLIPVLLVVGVLGAAAIGAVYFAIAKDCTASASVSEEGVKVEVDCKK